MGNACRSHDCAQCRVHVEAITTNQCDQQCNAVDAPCERTIWTLEHQLDESPVGPKIPGVPTFKKFTKDEETIVHDAVNRLILMARKPWPPETHRMVCDRWYKNGGMTRVMEEYYNYHMTNRDGVLNEMGLTPKQMTECRQMLEESGELETILESKIKSNMTEKEMHELYEARINELISEDCKYTQWGTIKSALDQDAVALLRGDWLVAQGHEPHGLPRRQELQQDAYWKQSALVDRLGNPNKMAVAIVVVSYCWRSSNHPDPDGEHVALLSALIAEFTGTQGGPTWHGEIGEVRRNKFNDMWQPVQSPADVAVFFDWCSLHQRPRGIAEEEAFCKALQEVEVWYVHRGTHVWMFTALPESVFSAGEQTKLNDSNYKSRGWPTFEQAVSTMIKDDGMVFDMGKLPPLWRRWGDVVEHCTPVRVPPKPPAHFENELCAKRFMFKGDCRLLVDKYAKVHNNAICKARDFIVSKVTWNPMQLIETGALLAQCFQLQRFILFDSTVGADSGCVLAKALPSCHTLEQLHLHGIGLGDRSAKALALAFPNCRNLRHVCLQRNGICDQGAEELMRCLSQSSISVLRLDKNAIGNYGGQMCLDAIGQQNPLRCLVLCDNAMDEDVKKSIETMWRKTGKDIGKLARQWHSFSIKEQSSFDSAELEKYGGILL